MPVREFELFHGAFLTKLVRLSRPLTLSMIETRPGDAWSTYRVNDAVSVLAKHSLKPRHAKRENACAWQFVFGPNELRQGEVDGTCAALVCGGKTIGGGEMEVCLLEPPELRELLDLSLASQQSVTVKKSIGQHKKLQVSSFRVKEPLNIPSNRLDKWDVPGS